MSGNSKKEDPGKLPDEEAQRRFNAALRGAREVGHKPMKEVCKPRPRKAKRTSVSDASAKT